MHAGLEAEGEVEKRTLPKQNAELTRERFSVGPAFGLGLQGSVYHPNLLQFNLSAEPGVSWQQLTLSPSAGALSAQTDEKWLLLQRYHGDMNLLQEKPYAVSVFADKEHNTRDYDFFTRATVDTQRSGGRVGYAAGPVPVSLSLTRLEEDVRSLVRPSTLTETVLSLDARNERARETGTTLSYTLEDFVRQELGIPLQQGLQQSLNVYNTESFGKNGRVKLNSSLNYNRVDETRFPLSNFRAQQQATVAHGKRLHSSYSYSYDQRTSGLVNSDGHQATASLQHQLYESLTSTVELRGQTLSSTAPDSSFETTRYGVGLSENYTKRLGQVGRLTLGYQVRLDQEDRQTTGQLFFIMAEPHTLTDGVMTFLNLPRVNVASVRVTDSTGTIPYHELFDYLVIGHGERTELQRVPGGTIPNGGTVLVDYTAAGQPSDSFTTLANQFQVRLDFLDGLVGVYGRLSFTDNYGGKSLILQEIADKVAGSMLTGHGAGRPGLQVRAIDVQAAIRVPGRVFPGGSCATGISFPSGPDGRFNMHSRHHRKFCRSLFATRRRMLRAAWAGGVVAVSLAIVLVPSSPSAEKNGVSDAQMLGVWPPPPAAPRLVYEQSIEKPADLGVRPSRWRRLSNWFTGADQGRETLIKPFGVALDEADNLCLTDTGAGAVCFFDRAKKKYLRWEKVGPRPFLSPVAIAKRNGTFYVADSGLQKVLAFDEKGKLRFEIGRDLERPAGLAIAKERLFVADAQAHRVVVFDLRGRRLSSFGQRGAGAGDFNFPTHLAADAQGRLFVTDSMNSRIQVFDTEGRFRHMIGSVGDSSGHFSRPKGVAADSFGHVYVVDALFDNFQVFDQAGRFLLDVGSAGSGSGEFWLPAGIAISRDNRVFVADSYNRRVQVFKYIGQP